MLVFGDLERTQPARTALARLAAQWWEAERQPSGFARHARLISLYVEAAAIAQGCVDDEFTRSGEDSLTPLHEAALSDLRALARSLLRSWRGDAGPQAPTRAPLERLRERAPSAPVTTRIAEGFAFYALYPEACFQAAEGAAETHVVIGVRSIGMALAPLLAAALDARTCLTLRPIGDPFARRCAPSPALREYLRELREARFAIVDEGPGLSGSSFGAMADLLEEVGVARERIVFYPAHAGALGERASAAHRTRWNSAHRRPLTFDCAAGLVERFADLIGAARAPARDISGGLWREIADPSGAPADRMLERRKYLVETDSGRWLVKFVGLGVIGARKAAIAHRLAEAGFAPKVAGLRHGFLAQRWIGDARAARSASRRALVERIAAYLAFRARELPALDYRAASMDDLLAMARRNIELALGARAARGLDRFAPRLDGLARAENPVATDNRMQAWEWIAAPGGALLKTDAADHCAGHDLVGCRDIAWDVAGAIVEFDLDATERDTLLGGLEKAGVGVEPALLDFFASAYCAFRLGAADMASAANAAWPQDGQRWRAERARYKARLCA